MNCIVFVIIITSVIAVLLVPTVRRHFDNIVACVKRSLYVLANVYLYLSPLQSTYFSLFIFLIGYYSVYTVTVLAWKRNIHLVLWLWHHCLHDLIFFALTLSTYKNKFPIYIYIYMLDWKIHNASSFGFRNLLALFKFNFLSFTLWFSVLWLMGCSLRLLLLNNELDFN